MCKAELRINPANDDDKSPKGLQNKGLMDFKCADCKKLLLVLQLVTIENDSKSEVLTRVAVKCGFCDGFSDVQQIPGQFYPGAPNDCMAFDILEDDVCGAVRAPEADVLFRVWNK